MSAWRWIAWVGLLTLVLGVAACETQGEEVATLPTASRGQVERSPAVEAPELPNPAEAMAECLTDAGLPAKAEPREFDGVPQVELITDEPYQACFAGEFTSCVLGMPEDGDPDLNLEQRKEYADQALEGDALRIGDADHSEVWAACLAATGYTLPGPPVDKDEELAEKAAIVEATLAWASCARTQGLTVTDPEPPVADAWATRPAALLDPRISPDELHSALEACPNFDVEAHEADAAAQREADYDPAQGVFDPEIKLDAPGWRGEALPQQGSPDWTPELAALWDQITSANHAFWDSQGGVG
ncbi:MAG: hypothetical protein LBC97_16460 [Bifidobacteriaceae bacterium]|jgi:hypothetical protein|nr:hypothetical protein [Bifidobacteriaceae bacterium]